MRSTSLSIPRLGPAFILGILTLAICCLPPRLSAQQVSFLGTSPVQLAPTYTSGGGFSNIESLALDANENIFVIDGVSVKEITAASGYTTVVELAQTYTQANGFRGPGSVTVDGVGNVFVLDGNPTVVKEITAASGYTTVKTLPALAAGDVYGGLVVNPAGDVFLSGEVSGYVYEMTAASGYSNVIDVYDFDVPYNLAVDAAGDVFVSDLNAGVYQISAASGYTSVLTLGGNFVYANINSRALLQPTRREMPSSSATTTSPSPRARVDCSRFPPPTTTARSSL
jgi:hypothetical protein